MYRIIVPALVAFALTMIMPQLTLADESLTPATVIVYRADESVRTGNLRFDLHSDQKIVGRMKAERSIQLKAAPGPYTLTTSIPGEESLVMEVAEQVAINHGANSLAGTI